MFIPIDRNIKLVNVPKQGNFPYCTCVLIDDQIRVLLDSSCGPDLAAKLRDQGVDILINTHFHLDHTLNTGDLGPVPIWCHGLDAPAIRSVDVYWQMYGFHLYDCEELGRLLVDAYHLEDRSVQRELKDEEILDFGQVKLRVIHTPGHTPGHCSFFEEEKEILFSADIELSAVGPWYAHHCSDVDDYLDSIQKCMDLRPRLVIGGHNGVVEGDLKVKFLACRDRILRKEEKILKSLKGPATLEHLALEHTFLFPKLDFAPDIISAYRSFFNKQGVYKHLQRLIRLGYVSQEGDYYFKL